MRQLRLLDLYCGEGGAARGYQDAGFHVTGVDTSPQARYCGDAFIQGDVLALDPGWVASFDAVHASPPCQFGTALRFAPGTKKDHRNLIPATRGVLQSTGKPYVIENVSAVRRWLIDPVLLCGTMFGLGACGCELHRHRLFETNFGLRAPGPCEHSGGPVMGLYGGHARNRSAKHGGRGTRDLWPGGHWPVAAEAMQMPWATLKGMSEAIPPAYSRHIGRELAYWIDGRIVGSLTHKSRLTTL